MEEDILPKRYETFTSDNDWVQRVRCSLLGLEAGTTPSRRDIDTSSRFVPRVAASESDLPEVITDHWLPILRREGLLVECPPDQFTAREDWVPLYTCEGLQKHLHLALSSFPSQGAPSLTAIVPPEFCVGTDKEFLLSNFHHHECLVRQLFSLAGRCRQLAFCPYCGVINENSDMALSHKRKHLDLQFVCGGCYSEFPQWTSPEQAHEDSVSLCDGHPRPLQVFYKVGLLASPLPTTQGSRKWSPGTSVGPSCEPPLDHTRLPRGEPGDIHPPGCRPYVGSSASSNVFTFVNLF